MDDEGYENFEGHAESGITNDEGEHWIPATIQNGGCHSEELVGRANGSANSDWIRTEFNRPQRIQVAIHAGDGTRCGH